LCHYQLLRRAAPPSRQETLAERFFPQENQTGKRRPGDDQYGKDRVTICHRTPSGWKKTLVLPRPAAEAHLRNHEDDTLGPCPF